MTLLAHAELLGLDIRNVKVDLSTSLDARGFFGTDPAISASFAPVSVKVSFDGDNDPARLEGLLRQVEACCPLLAIFRNPVAVNLSFRQRG